MKNILIMKLREAFEMKKVNFALLIYLKLLICFQVVSDESMFFLYPL